MYSPLLQFFFNNPATAGRRLRNGCLLLITAIACLAFAPAVRAICVNGCLGNENTAQGEDALLSISANAIGEDTAFGFKALKNDTTGIQNTAVGDSALRGNIDGNFNTAVGLAALADNHTGDSNTAIGWGALSNNTRNNNTANGVNALANNTTGSGNIALGVGAGTNLTTGDNNIDIGASGLAAEANTIRIGKSGTQQKTVIAGISGKTVATGVGVIVGTTGQLGTVVSSARFKEAIKPMEKASEAILALKPVTFRYKQELDPDKIPQFGLVAEEVEEVDPDLVARDEDGKVMTVRYEAVNAMLLNEFLKEHRKVQELEKQVQALTVTVQKVSNQLEFNKSAPQVVASNH